MEKLCTRWPWLAVVLFVLATVGCAGLPERIERLPSAALPGQGTALAQIAARGRPADPALSGFRLLPTGEYAFKARIELARRAERSLDVQYYLLANDAIGQRFLRELRDAALRGVRVRLLVDDLYTGHQDALLAGFAAHSNVEVRLFNPLPVRGGSVVWRLLWSFHEFDRINHRMHNKLFVADGALSISGGRNIADEYFMASGAANFIDMDVLSSGPVVDQLSSAFDDYWNSPHVYPLRSVLASSGDAAAARDAFDRAVIGPEPALKVYALDPFGQTPVEQQLAEGRLAQTFATASVFVDSPEKVVNEDRGLPTAMRNTLEVLGGARSEVVVISPYFIPGAVGMPMMKRAREAGVRIRVFTNALGSTDEPLVHRGYARYRREMLRLGVELYEVSRTLGERSERFGVFGTSFARLHAKMAIVDGRHVVVGSMNLDGRSAVANTELGLVIQSERLAEDMLNLVRDNGQSSMLRVRLAANGEDLEWVLRDASGKEIVETREPDDNLWLRIKLWLLSPLASERLL